MFYGLAQSIENASTRFLGAVCVAVALPSFHSQIFLAPFEKAATKKGTETRDAALHPTEES